MKIFENKVSFDLFPYQFIRGKLKTHPLERQWRIESVKTTIRQNYY